MSDFFLKKGGQRLVLNPATAVGKGGEADVFLETGRAIKIFKTPSHPDLSGDPLAQAAARDRLIEHQKKLLEFPRTLPAHVVAPEDLVVDAQGIIGGYAMPLLKGAEVLYRYGERPYREAGVPDDTAVAVLADLFRTVDGVHKANVVIGDFNDLNVLAKGREAFLIDADSMQFGRYLTRVFTAKFVDPLVCDPNGHSLTLVRPHNADSDWYAYHIMLMQTLLFVGPYGGVYAPKNSAKRIPHDQRPLKRVTVFDPEVRYPKPARHYGILPDDLVEHLQKVFLKDLRGVPQLSLIEGLRFTKCGKCGAMHARAVCPSCVHVTAPMQKEIHTGAISARKIFSCEGVILHATHAGKTLRWLYHESDAYKREDGSTVAKAVLETNLRFRISGERTLIAQADRTIVFPGTGKPTFDIANDTYQLLPLIDANEEDLFYAKGSGLYRVTAGLGPDYPVRIGDVLPNQTLFWAGEDLGFGFYRAGQLSNFFVFRTKHQGINDSVQLPPIRGQLIDATCCFSKSAKQIWFLVSTKESGRVYNRCYLLDENGILLGSAEAEAGDGSWLSQIRGKCAAGGFLLAATDEGVVRVIPNGADLVVAKSFPATADFVDSDTQLFLGDQGLYAVGHDEIWHLVLK
jgi:H/ACA ribonucleoprotein complex subunit 3